MSAQISPYEGVCIFVHILDHHISARRSKRQNQQPQQFDHSGAPSSHPRDHHYSKVRDGARQEWALMLIRLTTSTCVSTFNCG
ncbi:hypothetical protein GUJ93_ZPchr0013g34438 [Zizania palustris]|uniref:Uncharacterized protein n=1 Tax=Zizania palustris TaxID=103762 RepID=A0A8J6C597_ZIZPA|nr:hypothetical protein GUJ93_ZPchr0013g34438 [Zizania palustris]